MSQTAPWRALWHTTLRRLATHCDTGPMSGARESSPRGAPALGLRDLVRLNPAPGSHRVALRAGLSVAVPLLTVVLLDRTPWAIYAAFGAFVALYGRNHVHLPRAVMQASAGLALVGSVVLGAVVAAADTTPWALVVGATFVAARPAPWSRPSWTGTRPGRCS